MLSLMDLIASSREPFPQLDPEDCFYWHLITGSHMQESHLDGCCSTIYQVVHISGPHQEGLLCF